MPEWVRRYIHYKLLGIIAESADGDAKDGYVFASLAAWWFMEKLGGWCGRTGYVLSTFTPAPIFPALIGVMGGVALFIAQDDSPWSWGNYHAIMAAIGTAMALTSLLFMTNYLLEWSSTGRRNEVDRQMRFQMRLGIYTTPSNKTIRKVIWRNFLMLLGVGALTLSMAFLPSGDQDMGHFVWVACFMWLWAVEQLSAWLMHRFMSDEAVDRHRHRMCLIVWGRSECWRFPSIYRCRLAEERQPAP